MLIWLYDNLAVWPLLQSATRGKSRYLALLDLVSICIDKEQKGTELLNEHLNLNASQISAEIELSANLHWLCSSDGKMALSLHESLISLVGLQS